MDYEKKYKEALERAKQLSKELTVDDIVEQIFPELKESEDESIRKRLIELLKKNDEQHFAKEIAWLEKQGEQKIQRCGVSGFTDIVQAIRTVYNEESAYDLVEYLTDLVSKKEQKPAWSEEDETTKNNISHIISQYDKISKKENQPCWYVGDCLLWIQNIKDRVQPKQEWSEEDEQL